MKWAVVGVLAAMVMACGSAQKPVASGVATASCKGVEGCAAEVARDPSDPHLRVLWGKALESEGRAAAAAREFRAAIRLATDPYAPLDAAAAGLVRLGDPVGCVSELDSQLASADRMPTLAAALKRAREVCAEAAAKKSGT